MPRPSLTDVQRRDPTQLYHKLPAGDLARLTPVFQWTAYLRDVGAPNFAALNIAVPGFFEGAAGDASPTHHSTRSNSICAPICLQQCGRYAAEALHRGEFRVLRQDPGRRQGVEAAAGNAVSPLPTPRWARISARSTCRNISAPNQKAAIADLVKHLRAAYAADIQSMPWMGKETKQKAEAKLQIMINKDRLPRQMARLFEAGDQARRPARQPFSGPIASKSTANWPRSASRPTRASGP
ncbi:MAG: M13 family metallopeptidase N-terminal domain-containing protein [Aliidongia sp.]